MKKFLVAAGVAALALTTTPAQAVTPTQQATATARIVSPLQISWVQDLDLGIIVLSGTGTYSEDVNLAMAGPPIVCGTGSLTCSGSPKVAKYHLIGTKNQNVQVTVPNVTLTNQNDNTKTLTLTPNGPGTVNLGATGAVDFSIGGKITVANTTTDGTYLGTFAVTADYN